MNRQSCPVSGCDGHLKEFHESDHMTCHPHWTDISTQLGETQTPQDRPDIVARVLKERKDRLLHDLTVAHVLGRTVAHLWVIEFQERGLPHAHILIILDNHAITATPEQVDSIVCSELPPDPAAADDPEIKASRQTLQNIVVTSMIHGPCGDANPLSPCMENGRCTKSSNTEPSWTPTTATLYTEGDIAMTVDARLPIRRPGEIDCVRPQDPPRGRTASCFQ